MGTCLVVDDSSVTREMVRSILERMGLHVMEAEGLGKALAICRCVIPEAILLDWDIPIMDGCEFLDALLALPGGDRPRVVFCTTEDIAARRATALNGGAWEAAAELFDSDAVAARFRRAGLLSFTLSHGAGAAGVLDS